MSTARQADTPSHCNTQYRQLPNGVHMTHINHLNQSDTYNGKGIYPELVSHVCVWTRNDPGSGIQISLEVNTTHG